MNKFGRNYNLKVQIDSLGRTLNIELPFTIEFDITRNTLSSANVCQIRLYNLSKLNREQLYFNSFDQKDFRLLQLQAGYGSNNLATIFTGNYTQSWSYREGVNFISQLECFDGGYAFVNGTVDISFPEGTPLKVVIETLIAKLPNVSVGAVGNFTDVLKKGNSYSGNPAQLLYELTGGAFFIDNGKAYALQSNEFSPELPVTLIDADTGLLNTPRREQTKLTFEMLFEPNLYAGGLATVVSLTNPAINGTYKVTGVKHRGTISSAVCGSLITTGELTYAKVPIPAV